MEGKEKCQVKGCEWFVVLCPELCQSHWWKLDKGMRDNITRSQTKGQEAGNHPSPVYQGLIGMAIQILNILQGNLPKYVIEPGDRSTRHSRATSCLECGVVTVHHGVIRAFTAYLVCNECQAMIPSIPDGSQALPGLEAV